MTNEQKNELMNRLANMRTAFLELNETLDKLTESGTVYDEIESQFNNSYPFSDSFDETMVDVYYWTNSIISHLIKSE